MRNSPGEAAEVRWARENAIGNAVDELASYAELIWEDGAKSFTRPVITLGLMARVRLLDELVNP